MPPSRYDRPLWLTFLCSVLLMFAIWNIVDTLLHWYFPRPLPGAPPVLPSHLLTQFFVWAGVGVLSVFLIRAGNWARLAFLAYTAAATAAVLIYAPKDDATPIVSKLVISCILLLLPPAHRYYMGRDPARLAPPVAEPAALEPRERPGHFDY